MTILGGLLTGLVFGVGLALSGMTQPAKVVGFLDFAGNWDPTLMFVLGGALLVYAPLQRLIRERGQPLFWQRFELPLARRIDGRLLVGSASFGAGWGLAGFCPGPGLVAAGSGAWQALVFAAAMLAGMGVHHLWMRRPATKSAARSVGEATPDA